MIASKITFVKPASEFLEKLRVGDLIKLNDHNAYVLKESLAFDFGLYVVILHDTYGKMIVYDNSLDFYQTLKGERYISGGTQIFDIVDFSIISNFYESL